MNTRGEGAQDVRPAAWSKKVLNPATGTVELHYNVTLAGTLLTTISVRKGAAGLTQL
jgi:hypothetical protein